MHILWPTNRRPEPDSSEKEGIMCFRFNLVAAFVFATLVSLAGVQSISFAGAASHGATLQGHVRSFGHHHPLIKQPNPLKQSIPTVNVMDFGAKGDGVTDDTGAIQNAIAFAQGSGKGVLFPAGTYLHTSIIYDNGVSLIGVGGASVLLANNPNATAIFLTGVSPSIQNMVINSSPASTGVADPVPTHTTLLVQAAQNFVVQGITIVQGTGREGVLVQQSAVGNVSGVTINGTGSNQDVGIIMDGCSNVAVVGNLVLNEIDAIVVGTAGLFPFVNSSIALIGNSISTGLVNANGIATSNVETMDLSQNQIQFSANSGNFALQINGGDNNSITQNVTSGGVIGIFLSSSGVSNVVSQNIIRDCRSEGAIIQTSAGSGNVAFLSNQLGECGTVNATPVVQLAPGLGPNDITVINNIYTGHANALTFFLRSTAHLNFVSGNTQTQTALANSIP
jgi:hypothetical protein